MEPVDLRPATAVLSAGVGSILVADVWLMANGRAPVTAVLRHPAGLLFLVVLGGHVAGVLGRADPFGALGRWSDRLAARALVP